MRGDVKGLPAKWSVAFLGKHMLDDIKDINLYHEFENYGVFFSPHLPGTSVLIMKLFRPISPAGSVPVWTTKSLMQEAITWPNVDPVYVAIWYRDLIS